MIPSFIYRGLFAKEAGIKVSGSTRLMERDLSAAASFLGDCGGALGRLVNLFHFFSTLEWMRLDSFFLIVHIFFFFQ